MIEEWKAIPGYEGLYEVSNTGRIRTDANKVTSNARFPVRHWKQRIMKPKYLTRSTGKKDARICLWKSGKGKTFLVSRLVAMAWCGGYSDGMTVNHIDGNSENNNADNLEWVTLADNIRHGFDTGLFNNNCIPVTIEICGIQQNFPSMSAASRALGHKDGYISNAIKKRGYF